MMRSIKVIQTENDTCCALCKVNLIDSKADSNSYLKVGFMTLMGMVTKQSKESYLKTWCPEILLSDNDKEFVMTQWSALVENQFKGYVCKEYGIALHFTNPYTPRSKASIRKLCQEDNAAWDQFLYQMLFAFMCFPHTSTGDAPYTLLSSRDPPSPSHKLVQAVKSYKHTKLIIFMANKFASLELPYPQILNC